MKFTVKTLDQKQFKIDIEPDFTIGQVKEVIQKEKGGDPTLEPSVSKLIYKGKILKNNDQKVQDCKVDEKGFFVIMPGKAKSQPIPAAVEETPKSSKPAKAKPTQEQTVGSSSTPVATAATDKVQSSSNSTPAPAGGGTAVEAPTTAAATTTATTTPQSATPQETTTNNNNDTNNNNNNSSNRPVPQDVFDLNQVLNQVPVSDDLISTVSGFGFSTERAKLALQIANNNPDVAVELLFSNGLETAIEQFKRQMMAQAAQSVSQSLQGQSQQRGTPAGSSEQSTGGEAARSTGETTSTNAGSQDNSNTASATGNDDEAEINRQIDMSTNPLAYLTADPTFQRMLQVISENPDVLPQVLQQISNGNPELFNQIQNNHESFLALVNQAQGGRASGASGASSTATPGVQQGSRGGADQGRVELRITQQEREAINRLMALGFSEVEAVQAYMACDKNEELAANFLFDSM